MIFVNCLFIMYLCVVLVCFLCRLNVCKNFMFFCECFFSVCFVFFMFCNLRASICGYSIDIRCRYVFMCCDIILLFSVFIIGIIFIVFIVFCMYVCFFCLYCRYFLSVVSRSSSLNNVVVLCLLLLKFFVDVFVDIVCKLLEVCMVCLCDGLFLFVVVFDDVVCVLLFVFLL